MTTLGVLFVDHPTEHYRGLSLPENWVVHFSDEHLGMAASMEWCFHQFPDAPFYGWLSDDLRPRTPGWDVKIVEATGRWRLGCCDDAELAQNPAVASGVLSGAQCYGGDLVRAVGWWALPEVYQGGIDDAWGAIARELGNKVYLADVLVEHLTFRNNKRPRDSTDEHVRSFINGGENYIAKDFAIRDLWQHGGGAQAAAARVHAALDKAGAKLWP